MKNKEFMMLQLFAAGDNNDMPVRSYQLEFKRLLKAVFKKMSYFADFFGGFHSVQKSLLNVHENNILFRGIVRKDVFSILKFLNQKFQSVFFFVSIQVSSQHFQIMRIIFHCCNTKHVHPPCLFYIIILVV